VAVTLTLDIIAPQSHRLGGGSRKTFRTDGGSIGRDPGRVDWSLPDQKVSSVHALITWRDGIFYIENRGRNGTCVNTAGSKLAPGRSYALSEGDRILIDPYEIKVSLGAQAAAGSDFSKQSDDPFAPLSRSAEGDELLDPLLLIPGPPKPRAGRAAPPLDINSSSPLQGHFQPPDVISPSPQPPAAASTPPPSEGFPLDYDPLLDSFTSPPVGSDSPRPPDPPPPVDVRMPGEPGGPIGRSAPPLPGAAEAIPAEPRTNSAHLVDLCQVLDGAGLEHVAVTADLARSFGQIFRAVVAGVMDVLRSRQEIKDEFRMRTTQFRAADNNPLKFSANVDDALHNLLVKRNDAYLTPVEAFTDAFDDLRHHQLATLAGMRTAFEAMLAEFDPGRLQDEFDRQNKKGGLLSMPSRLRYWEMYSERQRELLKDPERTFQKLFGEVFAKAYDEQLQRLKAQRSTEG